MTVYIDPRNRMVYSSFYIVGLIDKFGTHNIRFSLKPFKTLMRRLDKNSYDSYMAFVVSDGKTDRKYIIDFRDSTNISSLAYDWCDKYAKINISFDDDIQKFSKLISIPPGFGVRAFSKPQLVLLSVINLIRCRFRPLAGIKSHFADYYAVVNMLHTIQEYEIPAEENNHYIFHASTFWNNKNCMDKTNPLRLAFMRACVGVENVVFEGGFFFKGEVPEDYKAFSIDKKYPRKCYIDKTKQSVVVFNTPAVFNCHGWKLGEYLAMGKVIISSPISNRLPAELVDGVNVLLIHDAEDIEPVLKMVLSDSHLRHKIKSANKRYYEEYVRPVSVIERILS